MKATEQYLPVVLFIMLYKMVLSFESVDEILKCGHSNESYWTVQWRIQGKRQGDPDPPPPKTLSDQIKNKINKII